MESLIWLVVLVVVLPGLKVLVDVIFTE